MNVTNCPALIDSHCHLQYIDLAAFQNSMENLLNSAKQKGVNRFLSVCVEPRDMSTLEAIACTYPEVRISAGIHPNSELERELDVAQLVAMAQHDSCIAIGETGLDYYRTEHETLKTVQRDRFRAHIQAAIACNKPLIIHSRDAQQDTIKILSGEKACEIGGVLHCFTETWTMARALLDMGFYISFSGIVTFKNASQLHEVAKKVPLDRMLIETDAPYLAPVPFRGKQNHPALVQHVAEALAQLKNVDYESIAQRTTENYYECFRDKP